MSLFVSGLVLFFVLHFATATPPIRQRLVKIGGENAWRGVMTLGALAAFVMIGLGWKAAPNTPLFAPSAFAIEWAPVFVFTAFILFVIGGGNLKGYIKRTLHHPMLLGVILWSGTHLLATGSLRANLLFGSFLAFSVYALCSLWFAGKRATFVPALKWDVIGIVIGLIVATGVLHSHQWLYGV